MSALTRYRRAQRSLREWFDPFTADHCPNCPTPCCRKPTQVAPFDLILVEELGYSLPPGTRGVGEWLAAATAEATNEQGMTNDQCPMSNDRCPTPDEEAPTIGHWTLDIGHSPVGRSSVVGDEPCDYLTPTGCAFPPDLRPFGCAVDICVQMRLHQEAAWLAEAERRATRLRRAHRELLAALHE